MANTFKFGNGNWASKKEAVLAYNDENSNFKPLPFTFDRASSATVVNKQGLIETVGTDEPRIDFLNNSKGHLLLEPSRTNSFQQSNQFDTTWQISAAGISVTPNQVGVGGSTDAWKLTEGTFNGEHFIRQTPNVGGVVSFSVYAKAGTNDFIYLRGVSSGFNKRTWFNLSNGTVGTSQGISAEMISMGNGWYRCVMILDHQTAFEYYIATSKTDGVSSYQGDNGFIYIQNSQLEQGSYATSYIPTQGSAVTRSAETCEQTLPDGVIGQTEGVLMAEVSTKADFTYKRISLNNGSFVNSVVFDFIDDNNLYGKIFVGGSPIATILASGLNIENNNKLALKYKQNDFALWVNGFEVGTVLSGVTPSGLNTLGLDLAGNQNFYGKVKDLRVYNTALTDAELQALTTL